MLTTRFFWPPCSTYSRTVFQHSNYSPRNRVCKCPSPGPDSSGCGGSTGRLWCRPGVWRTAGSLRRSTRPCSRWTCTCSPSPPPPARTRPPPRTAGNVRQCCSWCSSARTPGSRSAELQVKWCPYKYPGRCIVGYLDKGFCLVSRLIIQRSRNIQVSILNMCYQFVLGNF